MNVPAAGPAARHPVALGDLVVADRLEVQDGTAQPHGLLLDLIGAQR